MTNVSWSISSVTVPMCYLIIASVRLRQSATSESVYPRSVALPKTMNLMSFKAKVYFARFSKSLMSWLFKSSHCALTTTAFELFEYEPSLLTTMTREFATFKGRLTNVKPSALSLRCNLSRLWGGNLCRATEWLLHRRYWAAADDFDADCAVFASSYSVGYSILESLAACY